MDHSTHSRLDDTEIIDEMLSGAPVYGPDDETVGYIDHLHGSGPGAQVIIDVGGFLGIGAKPVLLPVAELVVMRDEDGDVHAVTTMTKEQLKALPEHHH
jgi:hypothetical protein